MLREKPGMKINSKHHIVLSRSNLSLEKISTPLEKRESGPWL
jgi:hypothetical protein